MDAEVDRGRGGGEKGQRALEVILQSGLDQAGQRTQGIPGRGRVGSVRFDQARRPVATEQVAREVLRNIDYELNLAAGEGVAGFGLALYFADKIEVTAVFDGFQESPGLGSVIGHQDGSGQMLGVRVDGEAEENELEEGDADHHREREPVTAHLDGLLDHHGPQSPQGEIMRKSQGAPPSVP